MEAQHHRTRVLSMKAVAHNVCPHAPGRAELRHLFKQVIMAVEKEGELPCKFINVQSGIDCSFDIADGIGERKGYFLHCCGACLTNMIATNADGVPPRQVFGAIAKQIGDDAHRVLWRVNIRAASSIFLEDIVLYGAGELAY